MGPLQGIKVVELSHEHVAWAGKLLADMGAEVVVIEPPAGSAQRRFGPYLDDEPGPERSLWWLYYNTGKRGVVADLDSAPDRERVADLVCQSDVLLEAEPPGYLGSLGLGWSELSARSPGLVGVSVTPFGERSSRSAEPATDLTLMSEAGPVWSCGYDDHELPPVRGGGNQGFHTACHWAVVSLLVALLHREQSGVGQHIDVSMSAANNVTTEMASYGWLACQAEVQRQTGRHAAPTLTPRTQVRARDGRYVTTGVPPRDRAAFVALLGLLDRLGLRDDFPMVYLLELATQREGLSITDVANDPMVAEIFTAARDVVIFLASRLDAYDFFCETQKIGIATGVVYTPGEAMRDPNVMERGFPTQVAHPQLGRTLTYPGAPYRFGSTPWSTGPAPTLGEHQHLLR
jgi:crotonobetainyl-CoA:carnitine CoA-transferase CaiB-like acyl-CoA transferase